MTTPIPATESIAEELAEGVWRFQSPQWQTNSLVVLRDGAALVVEPAWTPAEIERIHATAAAGGRDVHFIVTHGDPDHVCGMGAFGEATIYVGTETAKLIEPGLSTAILHATGRDFGMEFPFEVRYDRAFEAGSELTCGPFRLATLDGRGHMIDGVAYVLLEEGILVPGDNLCPSFSPLVFWSVSHARRTTEALLEALQTYDIRWVAPGHGSVLTAADARKLGLVDLAYLEQLESACAEAKERGLSWADSFISLMAIDQPRANAADVEIYTPKAMNARRAMLDAGILRAGEERQEIGMPPQFLF